MVQRIAPALIATMFLGFVFLPALEMSSRLFVGPEGSENRVLAGPPALVGGSSDWYAEYEKNFNEKFGFRDKLIRWNSIVRVKWLGISPLADVVIGKESWLFYRSEAVADGSSMDDYQGIVPLSNGDMAKIRENLERDHTELARHGIVYLVVVAPNKHTIYPEYLPENIRKINPSTRLDQLLQYLKANSKIEILDLREPLKRARRSYPVYYKTDSHWNKYGAYVGYLEIMDRLSEHFPNIQPIIIDQSKIAISTSSMGEDLPEMLSIRDLLPEENHVDFDLPSNSKTLRLHKLFFKHDSFGDKLYEFFYHHFDRVVGMPPFTKLNYSRIEAERPDVVLNVLAERYLNMTLHDDYYLTEDTSAP